MITWPDPHLPPINLYSAPNMQKTRAQIQQEEVVELNEMATQNLSDEAYASTTMLLSFRRGDVSVEDFLYLLSRVTTAVTILTLREVGIGRQ